MSQKPIAKVHTQATTQFKCRPAPRRIIMSDAEIFNFECEECGDNFDFFCEHVMKDYQDENKKNLACKFTDCSVRFKSSECRRRHYQFHKKKNDLLYNCSFCEKRFNFLYEYENHLISKHEEKQPRLYLCKYDGCKSYFKLRRYREIHYKNVHEKDLIFKNILCQKSSKEKVNQKEGLKNKTNSKKKEKNDILDSSSFDKQKQKVYQCKNCSVSFNILIELVTHVRMTHQNEISRPFPCKFLECEKTFASRCTRHYHYKNVHSQKDYEEKENLEKKPTTGRKKQFFGK